MLRNTKKYVPILTFAAMLSGNGPSSNAPLVAGIRSRLDLDSFFDDDDSFFSGHKKKGSGGGFGLDDDSFFNSDDMGGFGHMSDNFAQMDDDFMGGGNNDGNTQFVSSSSSTSYSTMTGPDGQVHQQASQQGEQKVCVNGKCKSVKYAKGSDPKQNKNKGSELPDPHGEFQINKFGEKDHNQKQQKQQKKQRNDRFGGERKDSFADMNEKMKKLDDDFMNMETGFQDMEMPKMNMNAGKAGKGGDGNTRTQKFSSQTVKTSTTGPDGKVHTSEAQGAAMHCQDGECKSASTKCKDGNCEQVVIDHSAAAADDKKNKGKQLSEAEAKTGSKEVPPPKAEVKTDSKIENDSEEAEDL